MIKQLTHILIACTIIEALQSVRPGAQWAINDTDYNTLQWVDTVQTKPSLAELGAAITQCQSNQAVNAAYAVELSTTQTALSSLYPNLAAPSALQSIQAVKLQARITILKQILNQ